MLETLGEPDIRKMSIEEPEEKHVSFLDVLEELTEDDIEAIQFRARSKKEQAKTNAREYLDFTRLANQIRSLGIEVIITDSDFQNMDRALQIFRENGWWDDLAKLAAGIKEMGREPKLESNDMTKFEDELSVFRNLNEELSAIEMLRGLRILGSNVTFTDNERGYILRKFLSNQVSKNNKITHIVYWGRIATELGIEVDITPEDITSMKKQLESFVHDQISQGHKCDSFIYFAAGMKYLSEHLVSLKTGSKFSSAISSPPTERNF